MRTGSRGGIIIVLALTLVSALGPVGCVAKSEQELVGTWRTRLVGYNSVAAGVTEYDQTVTYGDNGTVVMDNTLPGAVNHVTGRYEVTKVDGKPAVSIKWDVPVDQPSVLYFKFQDDKLVMSRAPESLDLSEQLNRANQDPVVYLRAKTAPAN